MPSEPPPRPAPPRPAPLRHAMVKWHSNVRHARMPLHLPISLTLTLTYWHHPHTRPPGPYLDTHSPLGPPLPFRGDDEPTPIGDGARPRAVLTADTRNTAHKKDPPIFFAPPCSTKQHGWSTDTRCAIRLFLRLMRERVTSLPLPHAHQSAVSSHHA